MSFAKSETTKRKEIEELALPVRIDEALPFACYREAVEHRSPGSAAQPRHPGYPIHGILRTLEGFYNGYRFVQPFQG